MMRASATFTALIPLAISLAGCHPPDRKIYEESKACIGVLDASLSVVPPMRLYRAGLDRFEVDQAAEGSLDGALESGGKVGLDRTTIFAEVEAEKARAHAAYSDANAPAQQPKFARLVGAVKACLPKNDFSGNE